MLGPHVITICPPGGTVAVTVERSFAVAKVGDERVVATPGDPIAPPAPPGNVAVGVPLIIKDEFGPVEPLQFLS